MNREPKDPVRLRTAAMSLLNSNLFNSTLWFVSIFKAKSILIFTRILIGHSFTYIRLVSLRSLRLVEPATA